MRINFLKIISSNVKKESFKLRRHNYYLQAVILRAFDLKMASARVTHDAELGSSVFYFVLLTGNHRLYAKHKALRN